jgi:membrane protease subunit (stomatin/prohibitin family)
VLYSRSYDGTAIDSFFVSSASNAQESLQKALTMAIRKMLEDKALQQALLSAARSQPALLQAGRRLAGAVQASGS